MTRTAADDLQQLLSCDAINAVFLDRELRVRRMANATARLLGLDPADTGFDLAQLAERLCCPDLLADARHVLEKATAVTRTTLLADGDTRLEVCIHPSNNDARGLDGLLLTIVDVTQRWKANAVSRRLAAIVRYSDDAILSKDLNGIVATWNRGAERLFGYTDEEMIGQSITKLIPEGMPDEEPGILERIRRGEAIDHYETVRRRKDGTLIDVSLCVSPVLDDNGDVIGASKIARDITGQKRAEQQREVLINELNHRVKNTLATVQSIAYQSLRHATSLETFADTFNARLMALSKTQDLLTCGNWISAPLRSLVLNELEPYRGEGDQVALSGEDVQLQPRMVLAFGMMFHELTTNAVKYGALSAMGGHIGVSWKVENHASGRRLALSWIESGGPPIEAAPSRKGMGSRLLNALAGSLGGDAGLQYAREGLRYRIEVPLDGPEPAS